MTNIQNIRSYIENQNWYQKIELSNGIVTPGKIDCQKRLYHFSDVDFNNKTVLDLGCNSGYYCLWSKKNGAKKVVGIDIDEIRIEQAKKLSEIENIDIEFYKKSIFELEHNVQFDVVFCFAVLTEIEDILGTFRVLKNVIGKMAFVEMALAKPILYLSRSVFWLKGFIKKGFSTGVLEIRPTKVGWMISPSIKVVRRLMGNEFKVTHLGKGLRYDMIKMERI